MQPDDDRRKWSDERLFQAASQGDEDAFVVLARRCTYVVRFLSALCRDHRLPESVATTLALQTVRIAVAESAGKPIPQKRDRWDWLQRVALREFQTWVTSNRQVLPKATGPQAGDVRSPSNLPLSPPTDCVGKYLKWLCDDQRDLIEMVMLKGMSVEAAGQTIGWDSNKSLSEYIAAHRMIVAFIREHGCN